MFDPPGRRVTLQLCTSGGRLLGVLPPFDVALPFWQEVADVVAGARAAFGVDVTVLRLLRVERATTADGGPVTYLAEVDGDVPADLLAPVPADVSPPADPMADDPRRAPYARPGGPAADLAWTVARLAERSQRLTGTPRQLRTWNLSSIWQLPTSAGAAWLKVVPAFLAREGSVLGALSPSLRPPLLAADGARVLLGDVPGEDQYGARGERILELAGLLATWQQEWTGRTAEILDLGGVDRRPGAVVPAVRAVHARHRATLGSLLDGAESAALAALVDGLDARFEAVAGCGLPDVLVHGDFHPGNVRGRPGVFAVLDWGEAGAGNPAFDVLTLTAGLDDADAGRVVTLLADGWRRRVPGADLLRAVELLRPVAPLLGAVTYQEFLDAIEPDEYPYHAGDPVDCLRAAARALVTSAR